MIDTSESNLARVLRGLVANLPDSELPKIQKQLESVGEWKIAMFDPHEKQRKFIESSAHSRLLMGGNRSGKTTVGCVEFVAHLLGYRPWLRKDSPHFRTPFKPPIKARIVCEDFKATGAGVIVKKLEEWIPPSMLANGYPKKNQVGVKTDWRLINGSTFEIMTNEQEDDKFEGADLHVIWYDEPPRRPVWVASERGLTDHDGVSWFTMTPLKEPWIYDEIVIKSETDEDIFCIVVDTMDNVGYGLTKQGVDRYVKKLDDDEKESRIHGKYKHLSGLVYKDYNEGVHGIEPFAIPQHWPVIVTIDPHPRVPHAVLWGAVDPRNRLFLFDELFDRCLISELCVKIRAKNGNRKPVGYYCDPIAFIEDPINGTTWANEFHATGVPVQKATKDLARGINAVKELLKKDEKTGVGPNIFFFNTLSRTKWEIRRYQWDNWQGKSADKRTSKPKPVDKDDHMMECMYRMVLHMPPYRNVTDDSKPLERPSSDVY